MKKSIILNLIMFLVVSISCSKDDDLNANLDVYAVGTKFDEGGGNPRAVLFKNGTETALSTQSSYAYAMYVYQDDVYVVGQEKKSDGINHATIWKNGNPTTLVNGFDGQANSVYVSEGIVYVGGYQSPNNNGIAARLWKNNALMPLLNSIDISGTYYSYISSVYVKGTTVYASGTEVNSTSKKHTLWTNGVPQTVATENSDVINSGYVNVSEDNIAHVALTNKATTTGNKDALLWQNGQKTVLSNQNNNARVTGVFTENSNVYVAGAEWLDTEFVATVWQNNTPIRQGTGIVEGIYVLEDNIYTAVNNTILKNGETMYTTNFNPRDIFIKK